MSDETLPVKRFSSFHQTKAALYSWQAWQKPPGQSLDALVTRDFLAMEHQGLAGFLDWLKRVFPFLNH